MTALAEPVARTELPFSVAISSAVAQGEEVPGVPQSRRVDAQLRFDKQVARGSPLVIPGAQEQIGKRFTVQLKAPAQTTGVADRPIDAALERTFGGDPPVRSVSRLDALGKL